MSEIAKRRAWAGSSLRMRRALLGRSKRNNARAIRNEPGARSLSQRLGRAQLYLTRRMLRIAKARFRQIGASAAGRSYYVPLKPRVGARMNVGRDGSVEWSVSDRRRKPKGYSTGERRVMGVRALRGVGEALQRDAKAHKPSSYFWFGTSNSRNKAYRRMAQQGARRAGYKFDAADFGGGGELQMLHRQRRVRKSQSEQPMTDDIRKSARDLIVRVEKAKPLLMRGKDGVRRGTIGGVKVSLGRSGKSNGGARLLRAGKEIDYLPAPHKYADNKNPDSFRGPIRARIKRRLASLKT